MALVTPVRLLMINGELESSTRGFAWLQAAGFRVRTASVEKAAFALSDSDIVLVGGDVGLALFTELRSHDFDHNEKLNSRWHLWRRAGQAEPAKRLLALLAPRRPNMAALGVFEVSPEVATPWPDHDADQRLLDELLGRKKQVLLDLQRAGELAPSEIKERELAASDLDDRIEALVQLQRFGD